MRFFPDFLARVLWITTLVFVAWWLAALTRAIPPPPGELLAGLGILSIVFGTLVPLSRVANRRILESMDPDGDSGRATVSADGHFTWEPRLQPLPRLKGPESIHRWWDAEKGSAYTASVAFLVPDAVEPRRLRRVTARALKDATRALPARGKVHASAASRDLAGPDTRIVVRLRVQGVGATEDWARRASEAFGRAFIARLREARRD